MAEQRHTTTLDIRVDDREIAQLGETIDRAFSTKVVDAFTAGLEKQTRVFDALIKQQKDLGKSLGEAAKALKEMQAGQPGASQRVAETVAGTAIGTTVGHWLKDLPTRLSGGVRGELTTSLMRAVPGVGGPMADVVEGARQYYQGNVAFAGQRAEAFGKTGLAGEQDRLAGALGKRFGIMPEEAPGMLGNAAQQTGLWGKNLAAVAPSVVGMQRIAGVDQAGAVVGAAGSTGGQMSPQRAIALMKDTLSTAIVSGFQESRFGDYFQSLAAFTEQMRTQGFMMDPESINAMVRGIGASNAETLKGVGGAQFAQSTTQGMQKGMRGRGIASAILMKATGVTEGRDYFEAQEELERDPAKFFPEIVRILKETVKNISSEGVRKGFVRNFWEQAGFGNLSLQRAGDILEQDPEKLREEFFGPGDQADDFMKKQTPRYQTAAGPLRKEAGMRMKEIQLGGSPEVQKLVQTVHKTDMDAVTAILPTLSAAVTGVVEHAKRLISELLALGGGGASVGAAVNNILDVDAKANQEEADIAAAEAADAREFGDEAAAQYGAARNQQRENARASNAANWREFGGPTGSPAAQGTDKKAIAQRIQAAGQAIVEAGVDMEFSQDEAGISPPGELVGGH